MDRDQALKQFDTGVQESKDAGIADVLKSGYLLEYDLETLRV